MLMSTRQKFIYGLGGIGGMILILNLYRILLVLPDEMNQGAIYRIIYYHVPAAFVAFTLFFVALIASLAYLWKKTPALDGLAASAVEVGWIFGTINLVTGSLWGRIIWGIWWTWDARLTSMFVCWLIYGGYLVLRNAVEDSGQRATISAVLAIFAFADVPIVFMSIRWWRTQHPSPVLETGGLAPEMWAPLLLNLLALLMIATAMMLLRQDQEDSQRELDGLRRYAHAI
jgi:heme exporter protein C